MLSSADCFIGRVISLFFLLLLFICCDWHFSLFLFLTMTQIISEDETYTFEILQEKHLEESSKLLANVFTKYNPIDIFMKMTYEQFYPQALVLSKAVLDEKLKELE